MATNEVTTKLTINTDGSVKSIKQLQKTLQGLKNEYKNLPGGGAAEGAQELADQIKEVQNALEDASKELKDLEKSGAKSMNELEKEIQDVSKVIIKAFSTKSINDLTEAVSKASAEYRKLSEVERSSAKGKELQKNIAELNKQLKIANGQTEELEKNVEGVGVAIKNAFRAEKIIEVTKGLSDLGKEGTEAKDAVGKLADGLSALGPKGQIAAEVIKFAFSELNKEINATMGGADKLKGSFNATVETVRSVFVGTLKGGVVGTFKSIANAGNTFEKEYTRTVLVENAKRRAAYLKSRQEFLDSEVEKFDKIQADNNKDFEVQKDALNKRLEAEKTASNNRIAVFEAELEVFKNQKDIRFAIEKNGITDITKLNQEAIAKSGILSAEQLEQFFGLVNGITAERNKQIAAEATFQKDLTDRIREENERQAKLAQTLAQRRIDANNDVLENERISLEQSKKLISENLNAQLAVLAKEQQALNLTNKFDIQRNQEIINEVLNLKREAKRKEEQLNQEFAERELALEREKTAILIELTEKQIEIGAETTEKQTELINQLYDLNIENAKKQLATLNQNDKDYLIKQEELNNEIIRLSKERDKEIAENKIRFFQLETDRLLKQLEIETANLNIQIEKRNAIYDNFFRALEQNAEFAQVSLERAFGVGKTINAYQELKAIIQATFDQRVSLLQKEAQAQKQLNALELEASNQKLKSLDFELQTRTDITKERKQEIEFEKQQLQARIKQIQDAEATIDVKLQLDVKDAQNELKQSLLKARQDAFKSAESQVNELANIYQQGAELFNNLVDLNTQKLLSANDERLKASQEYVEKNNELLAELSDRESRASGARARLLKKEAKEVEERNKRELESQKRLQKEREEIELRNARLKKVTATAGAIVDVAKGITGVLASTAFDPTGILRGIQIGIISAIGAVQIAAINAQKFGKGGVVQKFAKGGVIVGNSHAQGGVKYALGGNIVELEGGEGVINKKSMQNPVIRNIASKLNEIGGGVSFSAPSGGKFASGGTLPVPVAPSQIASDIGVTLSGVVSAINSQRLVLPVPVLEKEQDKINRAKQASLLKR